MDAADRLRATREQAGLSLEEIAERTKIRVDTLRAIERGDLTRLPGPFYARAFVRAYARELGLPPDELGPELVPEAGPARPAPVRVQDLRPIDRMARFDTPRTPAWQMLTIAVVVMAAIFLLNRPGADDSREPVPRAIGTAGQAEPAVARGGNPATAVPASSGSAAGILSVEIRATAPVWVSATADGRRVIYRLLQAGDHERVQARDEIAFRVGDAGALTYSVNGASGQAFGAGGEVRDVRITRANLASFPR